MSADLSLIWAQGHHGVIGRDGDLPWQLPEDLERFRELTAGHTVVMGRATWESLPAKVRPLPDRLNIVLTRGKAWPMRGARAASNLVGLAEILNGRPAWVIGGGQVYSQLLPYATRVEVTEVDLDVPDGDAFAPDLDFSWTETGDDNGWQASGGDLKYRFLTYRREAPTRLLAA